MWAQIVNIFFGIAVTAAPAVTRYGPAGATNNFIAGPLIASAACIAVWEANRGFRKVNIALGAWLLVSALLFEMSAAATILNVDSGLVIALLSFVEGKKRHSYAGGWTAVWK